MRGLQQFVTTMRLRLGLWLLDGPAMPAPIAGGFTVIECPVKVSAIGGSSVTLILDSQDGEPHPIGAGPSGTGIVYNTPATPPVHIWTAATGTKWDLILRRRT